MFVGFLSFVTCSSTLNFYFFCSGIFAKQTFPDISLASQQIEVHPPINAGHKTGPEVYFVIKGAGY